MFISGELIGEIVRHILHCGKKNRLHRRQEERLHRRQEKTLAPSASRHITVD
jgi:hypothetical protein